MRYELSKWRHWEQTSKHFRPLPLHIGIAKENTPQSRAGWDNTLFTGRRDRVRSVSAVAVGPSWPAGPSWQLMRGHWPGCTPLGPQQKDPVLSPWGTDRAVGLARHHQAHTLKQNRGAHSESAIGNDIPTQGDKAGTGCVAPYLPGKTRSRPRPILMWPNGGLKTASPKSNESDEDLPSYLEIKPDTSG